MCKDYKELILAYKTFADTPSGQVVLKDLASFCCQGGLVDPQVPDGQLRFIAAYRNVYEYIMAKINADPDEKVPTTVRGI